MPKRTNEEYISDFDKKYGQYLIGKDGDYICSKCKKIYCPTPDDVNKKAMHTYYRCCPICRLYMYNKSLEYKNKTY
jgi:hypothetical protein